MKRTIVPFGPQHPVLPEPIHLDLVLEDEKVVEAIPSFGFVHRGMEDLASKRDFNDYLYVVERICGICSYMHGMTYCECAERIFEAEIPDRAKYLRTIWCELSRLHSHLLWLGLLADAFGFEALFMQSWRIREKILDMVEDSTGGRLISSVNRIGGVARDMDSAMLAGFVAQFDKMESELRALTKVFLTDSTVRARLFEVGILTKQDAIRYGAVGPMMRASGIELDTRKLGYAAYGKLDFDIITSNGCDALARCEVRIGEIFQSFRLIRQAVDKIPAGEIYVPISGNPKGEATVRVEQPRGEALYYMKANGTRQLERFRVRTPTFSNVYSLLKILPGAQFADVPLLILTIDPCISCTER
ncbi:MAG: nickel-dependent hydrogenase large subunit [Clostridia bacterium]|nr:nickel-dependent hydrogenase large subunit [Clostridia bacterium]